MGHTDDETKRMGSADERARAREVRVATQGLVVWSGLVAALGVVFLSSAAALFTIVSTMAGWTAMWPKEWATAFFVAVIVALAVGTYSLVKRRAATLQDVIVSVALVPGKLDAPRSFTVRSIHHLFGERDRLLPKKNDPPVDLALDAADLPEGLLSYLELLAHNGIEVRMLMLDPDSPLVSRHRFAAAEGFDGAEPLTQSIRAKMRKAIASVQPRANVRLYDAMPLGNLLIVGSRIFWGGIPSVPTDVSLPVVELEADIHGDLYWSYRRNFDRLWDAAKPAAKPPDAIVEPSPQIAFQAG